MSLVRAQTDTVLVVIVSSLLTKIAALAKMENRGILACKDIFRRKYFAVYQAVKNLVSPYVVRCIVLFQSSYVFLVLV